MQITSLEKIVKQLGADSAAIMMPNTTERHMYCSDSYAMPHEWTAIKNSFDEKVPGGNIEVYKTGIPAITNNLQITLEGFYIESVMIVPIYRGENVIATLELIHDKDKKVFSVTDQQIAQAFTKEIEPMLDVKATY